MSDVPHAELSAVALRFLSERVTRHQQLAYAGWDAHRDLAERVPIVEEAQRAGAVRVIPLEEHFDDRTPPEPQAWMAFWADATQTALASGFDALRAVTDTTPWLSRPDRGRFLQGDHLVDRFCVTHPLHLICVCDATVLDAAAVAEITCIHPVAHGPSAPFHLHASAAVDLALTGEIDTFSAPLLDRLLALLDIRAAEDELVIDATGLEFVNHAALLALERHAEHAAVRGVVLRTAKLAPMRLGAMLDLRRVRVEVVEPPA